MLGTILLCYFADMEITLNPGQRLTKDGKSLHIKRVFEDCALTTRGLKTYEELKHYTIEPLDPRKTTSVRLTPQEQTAMYKYWNGPSECIRWAIAKQEGKL